MIRISLKVIIIFAYGLSFGLPLEASLESYLGIQGEGELSQENILLISALGESESTVETPTQEKSLIQQRNTLKGLILKEHTLMAQKRVDKLEKEMGGWGKYILGAVVIVVCGGAWLTRK
jgi:hypothetical protein